MADTVDLIGHLETLAAATLRGGTVPEALSRARLAHDALGHVRSVAALLDPHPGRGSLIADHVAWRDPRGTEKSRQAASERIERAHFAAETRAALQTTTDTPGLLAPLQVPTGTGGLPPSPLLDELATPTGVPIGKSGLLTPAGWTGPTAVVDPPEGDPSGATPAGITASEIGWHTAAVVLDVARQILDFAPSAQTDLDAAFAAAVNGALEGAVLADLIAGATAMPAGADLAGSLDGAESAAATAWPDPAPTIVVTSPGGLASARRSYSGQPTPPRLIASAGMSAGHALVFNRPAVALYATAVQVDSKPNVALMGVDIAVYRYAAAAVRKQSAVIDVTLP